MPASVSSLRRERARQEAVQAQRLIDDFLVMARAQGMTPVPLRAQLMDGHEARTAPRRGTRNAIPSLAIGENGEYYHLVVPGGFAARMRGVKLHPSLPPDAYWQRRSRR